MTRHEQRKFAALDDWFLSPQGSRVAEALASELKAVSGFFHGTSLLQLGTFADNAWLSALSYPYQWLISPEISGVKMTVSALTEMSALPIDRQSIDCVVAPFTLELVTNRRQLINEIDRVLAPMGYAIFFGINPWSIWGLLLRMSASQWFAHARIHLQSALTVKRMFLNRGYGQCLLSNFYYIPPINNEKVIHKLEFLNEMGKMIWPYPASFYCLVVQKQDPSLLTPNVERVDFNLAQVC